jgi:hypothetical protein
MTVREIGPLFNLSIMTQVDEINSDRHCQMYFIEFIEGICRVADKVINNNSVTIQNSNHQTMN